MKERRGGDGGETWHEGSASKAVSQSLASHPACEHTWIDLHTPHSVPSCLHFGVTSNETAIYQIQSTPRFGPDVSISAILPALSPSNPDTLAPPIARIWKGYLGNSELSPWESAMQWAATLRFEQGASIAVSYSISWALSNWGKRRLLSVSRIVINWVTTQNQ